MSSGRQTGDRPTQKRPAHLNATETQSRLSVGRLFVFRCRTMKRFGIGGLLVLSACVAHEDSASTPVTAQGSDDELIAANAPPFVDRAVNAAVPNKMLYFGGRVISNAKVYAVWWGTGANLNPVLTRQTSGIADFFKGILNSSYMDGLNEYNTDLVAQAGAHKGSPGTNQFIGRGNFAGTLALTKIPSGNVTDEQVQAVIENAIVDGTLPEPDDNTLLAIFFPRSVSITIDGSRSCSGFGAYHFATPQTKHHVAYAIMPDCGTGFGGYTNVTSHELIEAVTDAIPTPGSNPDYPQAWNKADGNEVSDLCQSTSASVDTPLGKFRAQGLWFDSVAKCKVTNTARRDFAVASSLNDIAIGAGASAEATFTTSTTADTPQPLELRVVAPAGVTATISPSRVMSGESATVRISVAANAPKSADASQVIVQAIGTNGAKSSVHTAALLLRVAR